ncbi:MAG TPA: PKD domain-containing protein [Cyclobacteriaceae bacterium]|nr:PKD domain-containing protein [Cyclobacteriaceae bacterium]
MSSPSLNNTARNLVNDLDLRLVEVGGTNKLPWTLNPATPSAAATTGDNTRDNVEKIEFSVNQAFQYKIQVTNKGALVQGPQNFSLIVEYSSQIDPLVSYYWIGNSGNWEDGSHWSLTSGGPSAGSVPSPANRVVFDDKSFTITGQTVSLNANTSIASLRWFGSQFPVGFSLNGNTLSITEGMNFLTGQVTTPTSGTINFTSTASSSNSVDLNSNVLDKLTLNFNGNSSWNITGAASVDKITVAQGTVNFSNTTLHLNQLTTTGTSTLSFTTSTFQALQNLAVDFTSATLQSDNTSSIIILPTFTQTVNVGSGNFQGIVNLQSGTVSLSGTGQVRSIQGNGTAQLNGQLLISNLNLSGGSQLILQQGTTQTFTDKFVFSTSASSRVAIKSSSAGNLATLAFNNYYKICVDFIDVSDVKVDVTNSTVANAGQGSTLTANSINWLKADCSTVVFPDFAISNTCIQSSTYFTDASSGSITSRSWNFGDASSSQNTSTLTSPLHYYATAGPYTAMLTVSGASGSRSISKQVTLTANDLPNNTVQLNNGSLISTVVAQGYQWLKDGQIIAGATSRSYSFGTTPAEYSVLIFSNTCNKRSAPFLVTAVEESPSVAMNEIKIYPNPTSDILQIESGSPVLATSILDAVGREIRLEAEQMDGIRYRLNVSAIPNGLYILKVITREKATLQKVIIRK